MAWIAGRCVRGAPGDPLRGLSVAHLGTRFLSTLSVDTHERVYEIEPRIREAGMQTICPRDGRLGAAYVDIAQDSDAHVADIMLSYSWGYRVFDICSSLILYCSQRDLVPEMLRVWICCLCVNQFRVKEALARGDVISFNEFSSLFGNRVRNIGHIVALLSPWRNAVYLTRVWCLYEAWTALLSEDVELELIFPQSEAEDFKTALSGSGLTEMWNALADVRVQDAKASMESDREHILALVRQAPGGYAAMNALVSNKMQDWFLLTARTEMISKLALPEKTLDPVSVAVLCETISGFLIDLSRLSDSESLAWLGLDFCKAAGIRHSIAAADLMRRIGACDQKKGNLDAALAKFNDAMQICVDLGHDKSVVAARALRNTGGVRREQKRFDLAMECYTQALHVHEITGTAESRDAALVIVGFAKTQAKAGDTDAAVASFDKALTILTAAGMSQSPESVNILKCTGDLHSEKQNYSAALADYHKALALIADLGAVDTIDGAELFEAVGDVLEALEFTDGVPTMSTWISECRQHAAALMHQNPREALDYHSNALRIWKSMDLIEQLGHIRLAHKVAHSQEGEYV